MEFFEIDTLTLRPDFIPPIISSPSKSGETIEGMRSSKLEARF